MIQNTSGSNVLARVPTAAERLGDFSNLLKRFPGDAHYLLWNPFSTVFDAKGNSTRTVVPNNDLRAIGGINPSALQLMDIFPLPNGYQNPQNPNDLNNFQTSQSRGVYSWRLDSRVDYRVTANDNFYAGLSKSGGWDDNRGGVFPDLATNHNDGSYLINVNYVRVFGPSLANEFQIAYGKGRLDSINATGLAYLHKLDTPRNKFFKNIGTDVDTGLNQIALSDGYPSVGPREYWVDKNPSLNFLDNFSWVKKSHSLKFGFSYLRKTEIDDEYWRGVNFDATFTRAGSAVGSLGGDSIASLLLGIPTGVRDTIPVRARTSAGFRHALLGFLRRGQMAALPEADAQPGPAL